jgi:hypothetical protein
MMRSTTPLCGALIGTLVGMAVLALVDALVDALVNALAAPLPDTPVGACALFPRTLSGVMVVSWNS